MFRLAVIRSAAQARVPVAGALSSLGSHVYGPVANSSIIAVPVTAAETDASSAAAPAPATAYSALRASSALAKYTRYVNSDPTKVLAVTAPPPAAGSARGPAAADVNSVAQSPAAVRARLDRFNAGDDAPPAPALVRVSRRKRRDRDLDHPYNAYNLSIAIVGRPNVGKSTLFNKLAGRPLAIADGSAGVTRDWNDAPGSIAGLEFRVIDTAGLAEVDASLEHGDASQRRGGFSIHNTPFGVPIRAAKRSGRGVGAPAASGQPAGPLHNREAKDMSSNYVLGRPLTVDLQREILGLTERAVAEADIVVFVVDVRAGLNPYDVHFAKWLRRQLASAAAPTAADEAAPGFNPSARSVLRSTHTKPVLVVANKLDHDTDELAAQVAGFYELGFGDPVAISATHSNGMADLFTGLADSMGRVLSQWTSYQDAVARRAARRRTEADAGGDAAALEAVFQAEIDARGWAERSPGFVDKDDTVSARFMPGVEAAATAAAQEAAAQAAAAATAGPSAVSTTLAGGAAAAAATHSRSNSSRRSAGAGQGEFSLRPMPGVRVLRRHADDDGSLAPSAGPAAAVAAAAASNAAVKGGRSVAAAEETAVEENETHFALEADADADADAEEDETAEFATDADDDDGAGRFGDAAWVRRLEAAEERADAAEDAGAADDVEPMTVRVVVAGKPNVGKSTLINAVLGQQRLLTGPQAGITRDSVAVRWRDGRHPDHVFELVDTAGMKGVTEFAHSKFDRVDSMAMATSMRSLKRAHVLVLVIDIADGLYGASSGVDPVFAAQIRKNFVDSIAVQRGGSEKRARELMGRERAGEPLGRRTQAYVDALGSRTTRGVADVKARPDKGAYLDKLAMMVNRVAGAVSRNDIDIARVAATEGKSLIVVANKIDLLAHGEAEVAAVTKGLQALFLQQLAQNRGVTVVPVSAKDNTSVDVLPSRIVQVYKYVLFSVLPFLCVSLLSLSMFR
jgi:predicted GTPase